MIKKLIAMFFLALTIVFSACNTDNGGNGDGSSFVIPAGATEITDTDPRIVDASGTYDATNGWTGESGNVYAFFFLSLNEGETLHFDFSNETQYMVYMIGDPEATWTSGESWEVNRGSGMYMFITDTNVNVKVYVVASENE